MFIHFLSRYFVRCTVLAAFCLYLSLGSQVARAQSPTLTKVGIAGGIVALVSAGFSMIGGIIQWTTHDRGNWFLQRYTDLVKTKHKIDRKDLAHRLDTLLFRQGFTRIPSGRRSVREELFIDPLYRTIVQVKLKKGINIAYVL